MLLIGYPDWGTAGDHAPEILQTGPIALEGFDIRVLENLKRKDEDPPGRRLLPEGRLKLLAEFGGETQGEATARAHAALGELKRGSDKADMRAFSDPADQRAIWIIREADLGASRLPGKEDTWPSWEDTAVSVEKLGAYLRDFQKLINRYQYRCTLYGHFGQGCVHTRFNFDLKSEPGVAKFRRFMQDGADLVSAYGGSLSGEHGDGQLKAELLDRMYGPDLLQAFRDFKAIWDPDWKLNPGKVVDPYPLDDNLRTGPDYQPLAGC
ncbi:FAD-linked oxidase C-terminal domain-containing protein [Methylocystis sp. IM3]|uniref:FAD-binding oxidoreductase n=1 Tax=unclassified Methylocystis TaxID=2625913 RepID=UPI0030F4D779